MKKMLLHFSAVITLAFASYNADAQSPIYDGGAQDSSILRFDNGVPAGISQDTSASPLWQIGRTSKPYFSPSSAYSFGIMTDTVNNYPVNADNFFTLKIDSLPYNCIVDFWHRYETDSTHDGGIVEFSVDNFFWQNVVGDCNSTNSIFIPGIKIDGFYDIADTLATGQAAFSGNSNGQRYSRIQFAMPVALKPSGVSPCYFYPGQSVFLRFRFLSDATSENLPGWMIDSFKIERDEYPFAVANVNKVMTLKTYPNPSATGTFSFPDLPAQERYFIQVVNVMGEKMLDIPYKNEINLNTYPRGLYFYKVTNGSQYYSGQLQFN